MFNEVIDCLDIFPARTSAKKSLKSGEDLFYPEKIGILARAFPNTNDCDKLANVVRVLLISW